ncbi:MAG TPA: sulfurtransferase [Jiangellaceae bacterium]|nr:sulfurtransferase [Jiangellaceae bacterium]
MATSVRTVSWLAAHLDDPDLVVVDATTHLPIPDEGPYVPESGRATFDQEHIRGAQFAELLSDFADEEAADPWTVPSSQKFAESAGRLGIGDGKTVIVYDQSTGFWATRFWWHLRLEGFDDVHVLDGGLRAWKAAGQPVTAEPSPPPAPARFVPRRRPELLRSTEEVRQSVTDDRTVLVNVLDPATYRGETSTYRRRGHIPGSINLPVSEVTDPETGTIKPVEELRALFDRHGLLDPAVTPVTYCGGGIAATGVAHALALAGRSDVAVYDGSMTAWAADDDLELVTGPEPR